MSHPSLPGPASPHSEARGARDPRDSRPGREPPQRAADGPAAGAVAPRPRAAPRHDALSRQQEVLRSVIESISSELELRPLLTRIVRHACELIGADNGSIGLLDEARAVIRTEATFRMPADEIGAEMAPGIGIAGEVLRTGQPVLLGRYGDVPVPTQPELSENAVLAMPIRWRGRMIGFFGIGKSAVLRRGRLRPPPPFTAADVETLAVFARHAAIAIENARLYEQARRLAVIEERQRLARDLHDSVTQLLFGITLIAQSLPAVWDRDRTEGRQRLDRLLELSRTALAEMRGLLGELRPASQPDPTGENGPVTTTARLRRDGLVAALQALVADTARDGLRVEIDVARYRSRPPSEEEALYRIAQEALHNVVKHARAGRAELRLRSTRGAARLTVSDDGVGFDPAVAARAVTPGVGGLGLQTMAERAGALGGRLRVRSDRGRGTLVEVRLPGEGNGG